MNHRSLKRAVAWEEIKKLEAAGLGRADVVSELRDKFLLDVTHREASQLSQRPSADGFIRADKASLLFRNASPRLTEMMSMQIGTRPVKRNRGIELNWSDLDESDIRSLFDAVKRLAGL